MNNVNLDEIAAFDAEYKPQHAILPNWDTLSNGDYEFEVVSAVLERTKQTGDNILRVVLTVNGGSQVVRTYFLKSQENANSLGADLCALGLDCHGKRPFSQELVDAVTKMPRIKFRARKSSEVGKDNKTYHKLFITGRVSGASRPMPQTTPTSASVAVPKSNEDVIPF